jgi:hypothetical protein
MISVSPPMPWRVIACVVLAFVGSMALTSCGGSGDGDSANGTPTAATTPASSPTPNAGADRQIARESTLTLEDFPSGWTVADNASKTAKCEGVEEVKRSTTARADSSRFGEGENTAVQNWVYLFADEADAEQAFTQLSGKDTRVCYAEGLTDALAAASGLTVGEARGARLSLDPLGDQREAARVTLPVTTEEGQDVDVIVDLVFVRADRGISLGLFIDVVSPLDGDLREQLTATSVRRLSDKLSSG